MNVVPINISASQVAENNTRISCGTVLVIESVRLDIIRSWTRRRVRMKSIAAMYGIAIWQVEDIIHGGVIGDIHGPTVLHVVARKVAA